MRFFLQQITECCKLQNESHRVTPRSNLPCCKLQEKLDGFYVLLQLSTKFASCWTCNTFFATCEFIFNVWIYLKLQEKSHRVTAPLGVPVTRDHGNPIRAIVGKSLRFGCDIKINPTRSCGRVTGWIWDIPNISAKISGKIKHCCDNGFG